MSAEVIVSARSLTPIARTDAGCAARPRQRKSRNIFRFDPLTRSHSFNLKTTKGLSDGAYELGFAVAGDRYHIRADDRRAMMDANPALGTLNDRT